MVCNNQLFLQRTLNKPNKPLKEEWARRPKKRKLPFTNRGVYQQPPLKNFKILEYGYTTNEFEHACTQ